MLASLAAQLKQSLSLWQKQDIQTAAQALSSEKWTSSQVLVGDDCAAIPDGDGYLLLAAEGMLPLLVDSDPWFAGWSAIMVNVSDIYAMGGTPIAVVDTMWSNTRNNEAIWAGMKAASEAYNVPIVGGHTNCHSPYKALSVAILGRAKQLISSFKAQAGDRILIAIDLQGKPHPQYNYWNAATTKDPLQLRENLAILPQLAESGLCDAGKDISMGGIIGTLLMLMETSGCGALLNLEQIPCPLELALERWLLSFPSYGFLLSIRPDNVAAVESYFHKQSLVCVEIGQIQANPQLVLTLHQESIVFWDLAKDALTGFSHQRARQ